MYILANNKTRKSARALKNALTERGYDGININFGCSELKQDYEPLLNQPENVFLAINKKLALEILQESGIPTPLLTRDEAHTAILDGFKVVARKSYHSKGRGFYMCSTEAGIRRAEKLGATHFLEYIDNAEEFRVHIVDGKSIKISQKIFPEGTTRRNRRFGGTFQFATEFHHKKTLRKWAKRTIEVLGLDFGAVDLLYSDDNVYILECNSAPCLTDETSDTLQRYVTAFLNL